jgi:hypothetical protein
LVSDHEGFRFASRKLAFSLDWARLPAGANKVKS